MRTSLITNTENKGTGTLSPKMDYIYIIENCGCIFYFILVQCKRIQLSIKFRKELIKLWQI